MKKLVALSVCASLTVVALPASAESLRMICKSPRQEYLLTFDTLSRSLVLNPDTSKTKYAALAFEKSVAREAGAGMVGNGSNLGFYAEFRPQMKVDLFRDDKLFQSDVCRSPN